MQPVTTTEGSSVRKIASAGMPAFQWIIERYKSMPAIVVRATVGALLGTGDQLSDIVTIWSGWASSARLTRC